MVGRRGGPGLASDASRKRKKKGKGPDDRLNNRN